MNNKELRFGIDARNLMLNGMKQLTDAVGCTLGPRGKCVCISSPDNEGLIVTKDGVTVANNIKLKDKHENLGAQMLKNIARKTNAVVGDGTTTSVVIGSAIAKNGLKAVSTGANATLIKKGIDLAVAAVVAELKKLSKPISSKEDIKRIGTISANGDETVGQIIADAMERVGNDGTILIEDGRGMDTVLNIVEGMQFDRGYLSAHFITNPARSECELINPYILIYENKISDIQSALPFLQRIGKACKEKNRPILLLVDDIGAEVLSTLVINKMRGSLPICVIKAPSFGDNKAAMLEDLGILCGARVCGDTIGRKIENVDIDDLGGAVKVIVGKDATTIIGGYGEQSAIDGRVAHLKNLIDSDSGYDVAKVKDRISKLSGGVATISVGASTEMELKEKKDRIEDALHACKSSVEGIVAGGGTAFIHCIDMLDTIEATGDIKLGIDIIKMSLAEPLSRIVENAGVAGRGAVIVDKVKNSKYGIGYDAVNEEICDLFERGIIDPVKTTINCIVNSASISALFLSTECCIIDDN